MKNYFLVGFMILLTTSYSALAVENLSLKILTPKTIKQILGNYPQAGSPEEIADVSTLLDWQDKRTNEDCEKAGAQENDLSVKAVFSDNNGPLSAKEANSAELIFLTKKINIGANVFLAKSVYKRPRPYDSFGEIKPCIAFESSYSYPSGHTTIAQSYALLLSKMYPERAILIQKAADEASLYRIIGGVHYPSDVAAGKKLAQYLVKNLKN